MKSVTEKGLGILLRQGYGGQEGGEVWGGGKNLSLKGFSPAPTPSTFLPTFVGNSAFEKFSFETQSAAILKNFCHFESKRIVQDSPYGI